MKDTETKKVSGKRLVGSALVFAFCYVFLIAFYLIILLIRHGSGWTEYMSENYNAFLSFCVSSFLLYAVVYYYYYFEDRELLCEAKNVLLIFSIFTTAILICSVIGVFVNIYMRPTAMLALLFVFLLNRRQAIMLNFVFAILMFVSDFYIKEFSAFDQVNAPYFSLIMCFVCGTFGIFAASKAKTRGGLLLTGAIISAPTLLVVLVLQLARSTISWIEIISSLGFSVFGCFISAILALALMPIFELGFNRLTVFRLRELTSTNAPLLMRLQKEAPGTFNHSLIVAQLAEMCAIAIGENTELARAAGYYHDVGKLKQPDCFVENQTDYNIHDELTPELSADIIRSHAHDGYDLLEQAHLPDIIKDVAREHHGTLPIKFFYNKAMKLSGGDSDIRDYSYLGPTPHSKIAAIVMIADPCEAAARTLPDRSPDRVERMVRSIIEERMDLDQFADCDITLRELSIIKETIVDALSGVHHHRVAYPAIRINREHNAVSEEEYNDGSM
ncbi:MAG: HD domain-containing protein [Clostridiales bacterium]|nr:HD domain-containing protein [Clostridiales bacterium]